MTRTTVTDSARRTAAKAAEAERKTTPPHRQPSNKTPACRREALLPCPRWCTSHNGVRHCSDWRVWEGTDAPRFKFQLVRHDMAEKDGVHIGQTDFTVRVASQCGCFDEDGHPVDGFLLPNVMREFARWLTALAAVADPYYLNGEPLEWLTSAVRRGHTTAMPVPDGKARPCPNGDG